MRVMSINLRYDNPEDGKYIWANRFPAMKSVWEQVEADVVGIQEGLPHQINDLKKAFPVYNYLGKGREKDGKGEHVGIFFNKNKFTLLNEGHFWLSETPDIPGSQSYGSAAPRMATWIILKYEGKKLLVLNTHLDHKSQEARKKGIEIICDFIENNIEVAGIILTADLNVSPDSVLINYLLKTARLKDVFKTNNNSQPTYHGFSDEGSLISDYILTSKHFKLGSCEIVKEQPNGVYPSDHYPLYSDIEIEK